MKTNITASFLEVLTFIFILYYGYTGFSKLWDYPLFLQLSQFQPYIHHVPARLKWVFPFSELCMAGLLLFTATRKFAFYTICLFLFVVVVYRSFLLYKGQHLPCLCGPLVRKLSESHHLLLSSLLLAGSLAGLFLTRFKTKSPLL